MLRSIGFATCLALLLVGCGGGAGNSGPPSPPPPSPATATEFFFVANSAADSISAYAIDPISGALFSVGPPVAANLGPSAIGGTIDTEYFDKKYVYVSNSRSNDVSAFAFGALTPVPGSPFAAGTSPGSVAVVARTTCSSRGSPCGTREYLYVANSGSDTVSAYQIDQSAGFLTPIDSYATGSGPSAIAVGGDEYLYTANSGSNDISAFRIDRFFPGSLVQVAGSPFPSNGNVSSLAFGTGDAFQYPPGTVVSPGIKGLLYAANASGGTASIMGFSIHPEIGDTNAGALTALPGFPYDLPSCNYIVADQTGAYLYATAGTNVFGFSIDKETGALSPLPGSPIDVGDTADSVNIDPENKFLYVINHSAGRVNGFKLNVATGELTTMPGSPFPVSQPADFVATF